jgi:ATP-binding cassette subfamily B protein
MFSGTVRDNLIYAQPSATDEQVNRALALANAKTFVDALPQGLQTMLGEDGVGLSGGQRQRLAIARALIAEPAFLLLDEATSALDAESEQSIRRSVEALKGEMTILVIAHRLSTVRQADRILVFEEGELIASGTHSELVEDSELYARFADIQFSS